MPFVSICKFEDSPFNNLPFGEQSAQLFMAGAIHSIKALLNGGCRFPFHDLMSLTSIKLFRSRRNWNHQDQDFGG